MNQCIKKHISERVFSCAKNSMKRHVVVDEGQPAQEHWEECHNINGDLIAMHATFFGYAFVKCFENEKSLFFRFTCTWCFPCSHFVKNLRSLFSSEVAISFNGSRCSATTGKEEYRLSKGFVHLAQRSMKANRTCWTCNKYYDFGPNSNRVYWTVKCENTLNHIKYGVKTWQNMKKKLLR